MNIEERQQRGSIEYTVPIDSEKSNEDLLFGSASFAADHRNRRTLYRRRNHRRISDTFSRGHSRCISLPWRSHHVCGLLCCREGELPIGMIGERFRRLNHSWIIWLTDITSREWRQGQTEKIRDLNWKLARQIPIFCVTSIVPIL